MTGNLLGESFDGYVRDQIEIRQQLYGSGYDSLRTTEQINYLNNRNAWIKMASSVTIEDRNVSNTTGESINTGVERLKKIGFPNPPNYLGTKLAEQAVLFNGLSSVTPSTFQKNDKGEITDRTYGSYEFRSGVIDKKDLIWNQNFAYGLGGTNYGIQPMPGIVDFSVEAVNRGSIRKGTVTIKAFNKFQFELIELLYIRLGYTMLVEWGWDKYPTQDKNGQIVIESTGNTIVEDIWFNQNGYTQIKMLEAIERYRGYYDGNYDAFFGKVSNFDWSFNPDGSYNITLNLITIGDVIESLKIKNKVLPLDTKNLKLGDEESALISTVNNNIISQHLFLTKLPLNEKNYFNNTKFYKRLTLDLSKNEKYNYYVTFYELLKLIKNKVIPNIETKYGKKDKQIDIDLSSLSICNSYINLISTDPRICLVKPKLDEPKIKSLIDFSNWWDFTQEKDICEGTPKKSYTYGNIMNIYLNYEFIAENLKNTINDKEANIYEFLNKICQGINKSLGNVTNLEPVIKDDYIITIIEQNPLPIDLIEALGGNVDNKPVPLEIYGYNPSNSTSNFVKNISIKTKITPELSSQISIGATSEGVGTQNIETTAFSKWNEGLADRFSFKYSQANDSEEQTINANPWIKTDSELEKIREGSTPVLDLKSGNVRGYEVKNYEWPDDSITTIFFPKNTPESFKESFERSSSRILASKRTQDSIKQKQYENTWEGYLKNALYDKKYFEFNPDFISKGQDIFSTTYKELINKFYQKNGEVINTIGFIPVVFDLTLDGLSGIKIYQKLEIQQDFLPYQYPQAFDFLITKVNHKISNNGWDTQLNTISTSNLKNLPSEPLTVIGNLNNLPLEGEEGFIGPLEEGSKERVNIQSLRISQKGINEIKKHESFRAKAYDDFKPNTPLTSTTPIEGTLTIGYGFTKSLIPNLQWNSTITEIEADKLLRNKIVTFENIVKRDITVPLTQSEFDALVSIAYNVGSIGNTSSGKPTPLQNTINSKQYNIAANIIPEYRITSKGIPLPGLISRRKSEQDLYLS